MDLPPLSEIFCRETPARRSAVGSGLFGGFLSAGSGLRAALFLRACAAQDATSPQFSGVLSLSQLLPQSACRCCRTAVCTQGFPSLRGCRCFAACAAPFAVCPCSAAHFGHKGGKGFAWWKKRTKTVGLLGERLCRAANCWFPKVGLIQKKREDTNLVARGVWG